MINFNCCKKDFNIQLQKEKLWLMTFMLIYAENELNETQAVFFLV